MLIRLGSLLVAAVMLAAPSTAEGARARVETTYADSALFPVEQGFAPGQTTTLVFQQHLRPGWHVYWKNPGDSGLPLELDWRLPDGFTAGDVLYPTPEHISLGPLANYGHHGEPVFLLPVTAPATARIGDTVEVSVKATWLICEDICVPEDGEFALSLPVVASPALDGDAAALAEAARAAAPQPFEADAVFSIADGAVVLSMRAPDGQVTDGYFFPEPEGLIEPVAPQRIERRGERLAIAMTPGFSIAAAGEKLPGVFGYVDADGRRRGLAFTASRSAEPIEPPAAVVAAGLSPGAGPGSGSLAGLPYLLLAAFFGGLLLNIMPCVFPVIFIKAASLMKAAGASRSAVRRDGMLYGAGVVATFAALGGLLLILRAGGEQLGWGFHLQSPAVVLLSAYVLFLVGLNLAGLFHVGESLQGIGSGLAAQRGAAGSFFTGVLAVAVAAPCIGPFLTAPIGAAAFLPPAAGMAIFVVMGLGLAAPYLAVTFAPRLGALLPKPGAWMEVMKQALAFPVFAGAAYFLWVLAQQTGADGLARALVGALLLAFAAWLFELSKRRRGRAVIVRAGAALSLALAALPFAGLRFVDTAQAAPVRVGDVETVSYAPSRLDELRALGRGVFIDFTAAWCVTCQVNKLTVLSREDVAAAFADNDVTLMVADWTRRDPVITEALAGFGANGVPLYVYYPPEGAPVVLPQPLTARAIVQTVQSSKRS